MQLALDLDQILNWRREMPMLQFKHQSEDDIPGCLNDWIVGCDADIGGKSEAHLEITAEGKGRFHGNISSHVPDHLEVKIPGYAGFKSKCEGQGYYDIELWDTLPFRYLALRVRGSDGKDDSPPPRRFTVNIQTDGYIPSDLFQHRLFLKTPGKWETILIPFHDFVLTNDGNVESHQIELFRERVKTIGISLIDNRTGPFQLEIDWIKAINTDFTDGDIDQVPFKDS